MRLYVARHGEAGRAVSDDLRQLTARGVAETRAAYREAAGHLREPVAQLIASPLVRARQTAAIALELLPCTGSLQTSDVLRPESSPEAIASLLESATSPVMLVGHQPVLGELLSWLTGDDYHRYSVDTSSFYALDLIVPAQGCGTLLWRA